MVEVSQIPKMNEREVFNVHDSVHRVFRGPNRPTDLYEVDGGFFYCRSRNEAEEELKSIGLELLRVQGLRGGYKGLARRI